MFVSSFHGGERNLVHQLAFPIYLYVQCLIISMQSIDSVRNMPMIKLLHVHIYLMLDFFFCAEPGQFLA
jgi:hypothetical protein